MSYNTKVEKAKARLQQVKLDNPGIFETSGYAGTHVTRALFVETITRPELQHCCFFTLFHRHREIKGVMYLSIKQLAVELLDETMYNFANEYLGGWEHWQHLQKCKEPRIKETLSKIREEIALAQQALACESVIQQVEEGNVSACRIVIDKKLKKKKMGRPTDEEVRLRDLQDEYVDKALGNIDLEEIEDSLSRGTTN